MITSITAREYTPNTHHYTCASLYEHKVLKSDFCSFPESWMQHWNAATALMWAELGGGRQKHKDGSTGKQGAHDQTNADDDGKKCKHRKSSTVAATLVAGSVGFPLLPLPAAFLPHAWSVKFQPQRPSLVAPSLNEKIQSQSIPHLVPREGHEAVLVLPRT